MGLPARLIGLGIQVVDGGQPSSSTRPASMGLRTHMSSPAGVLPPAAAQAQQESSLGRHSRAKSRTPAYCPVQRFAVVSNRDLITPPLRPSIQCRGCRLMSPPAARLDALFSWHGPQPKPPCLWPMLHRKIFRAGQLAWLMEHPSPRAPTMQGKMPPPRSEGISLQFS